MLKQYLKIQKNKLMHVNNGLKKSMTYLKMGKETVMFFYRK